MPVRPSRRGGQRRLFVSLPLCGVLAACGGDVPGAGGAPAGGTTGADAAAPAATTRGLGLALVGPRLVSTGVMESRSMVTEAIYFATQQTGAGALGQVTSTGTVQVSQFGAVYQPQPTDRLVVAIGGTRHEFTKVQAQGDSSQQFAANWLAAPHRLAYTHGLDGTGEVRIEETFDGRGFVASVTGWSTIAGQRCQFELTARGGTQGGPDGQGADRTTQYTLTGSLRGEGLVVDVHETHGTRFVAALGLSLLPSQRGSASRTLSRIDSTAKLAGAEYHFVSVQAESGSKEKGGQSTAGVVALTGAVTKNGQPFRDCSLQGGLPVLATSAGVLSLLDL